MTARGPIIPFNRAMNLPATPGQPKGTREVHAWSDGLPRAGLRSQHACRRARSVKGPAIIEERETTTVIPPDWTATVDKIGCIFARKG